MDHKIDCTGKRLGRVASEIAIILQGKKNPSYDPRLEGDDRALVSHIDKLEYSGNKEEQKIYYSHTTQIGHLKKQTLGHVIKKHGMSYVLRKAVENMLPRNRLRSRRMKRIIFE